MKNDTYEQESTLVLLKNSWDFSYFLSPAYFNLFSYCPIN